MKLKIRFDNKYQTVDLDDSATEQLWLSLSIENQQLSNDEASLQREFDDQLNKPDYNSWHKHNRKVADMDMETLEAPSNTDYDEEYKYIRRVLKPQLAEAFIAVYLNDVPVKKYAAHLGMNDSTLCKQLAKAKERLKYFLKN